MPRCEHAMRSDHRSTRIVNIPENFRERDCTLYRCIQVSCLLTAHGSHTDEQDRHRSERPTHGRTSKQNPRPFLGPHGGQLKRGHRHSNRAREPLSPRAAPPLPFPLPFPPPLRHRCRRVTIRVDAYTGKTPGGAGTHTGLTGTHGHRRTSQPSQPTTGRNCTERFVTYQATYTLAGPPELRWGNLKGMSA